MAYSQSKASAKYNAKAYEEIKLRVQKGKKDEIKNFALNKNETLNGFINRAISETIERDMRKDGEANAEA